MDNVGFFKVKDIAQVADADLYDQLLSEFPQWVRAAAWPAFCADLSQVASLNRLATVVR